MFLHNTSFFHKNDFFASRRRPGHDLKDLVIYEMSVRCFTADSSSGLPEERRGTYAGVADKAAHLKACRAYI